MVKEESIYALRVMLSNHLLDALLMTSFYFTSTKNISKVLGEAII